MTFTSIGIHYRVTGSLVPQCIYGRAALRSGSILCETMTHVLPLGDISLLKNTRHIYKFDQYKCERLATLNPVGLMSV